MVTTEVLPAGAEYKGIVAARVENRINNGNIENVYLTYEECIKALIGELEKKAATIGANTVIGLRIDSMSTGYNNFYHAYGTAIKMP